MAVLGIVPVAAHAQQVVDLDQLVTQSGTSAQTSEPNQAQVPQLHDEDVNTNTASNTPINFAIVAVGPFNSGTQTSNPALTTPQEITATDADTNVMSSEQTQAAPVTQFPSQTLTPSQDPVFPVSSVSEILADLMPGT